MVLARLHPLVGAAMLLTGCTENARPTDELGPFYREADRDLERGGLDYPSVDGLEFEVEGPYVVLAGLTRLMTPSDPDLGVPLPRVSIFVRDMTQALLAQTESDDEGAFVLAVPVPPEGTDGYVELVKEGLPTVRQFDRRLDEHWLTMRLRMLDKSLYSIPRQILGQDDRLGFVQGSVYERETEKTLAGVRVEASSGIVAYLSDGVPIPKTDLTETQSQGVFFVANCPPGPLTLTFWRENQHIVSRTVLTWPHAVVTQVGIPVPY